MKDCPKVSKGKINSDNFLFTFLTCYKLSKLCISSLELSFDTEVLAQIGILRRHS